MNAHPNSRGPIRLVLALLGLSAVLGTPIADAQTWQQVFSLSSGQVSGITSDVAGNIYAGTDSGVFVSTDDGKTWTAASNGLSPKHVFSVTIASNGTILASTVGGIFRSTNGGLNWMPTSGLTENTHIDCFAWDRSKNFFAGDASLGVFYSSDDGLSWHQRNTGLPHPGIYSLTAAMNGDIYAGTNGFIAHSTDLGLQWSTTETLSTFDKVTALACDSMHNLFSGTSLGRFLRSVEGDTSWADILPGPISVGFSCVSVKSDTIFAGTADHGILLSPDDGFHWSFYNSGIPDSSSVVLCLTSTQNSLTFAGTLDGKIFRMGSPATRSVYMNPVAGSGSMFTLKSFATSGQLTFFLSEPHHVRIEIYNSAGCELFRLGEQFFPAGEHAIPLGSILTGNGVFLAVFETETGFYASKFLLVQ